MITADEHLSRRLLRNEESRSEARNDMVELLERATIELKRAIDTKSMKGTNLVSPDFAGRFASNLNSNLQERARGLVLADERDLIAYSNYRNAVLSGKVEA